MGCEDLIPADARISKDIFWLPRATPSLCEKLDKVFCRVNHQYKWQLRPQQLSDYIRFKDVYDWTNVVIVGRGPSLNAFDPRCVNPSCPIVCLNHAIHVIEQFEIPNPLFVLQQDYGFDLQPKKAWYIPGIQALSGIKRSDRVSWYNPGDVGCTRSCLTSNCAIQMVKQFGAKKLLLVGLDSLKGDASYASQWTQNANKISNYLRVKTSLTGIAYELYSPGLHNLPNVWGLAHE